MVADAGPLIALALQRQACGERVLVIMEDRCGRAEARRQGLPILGTAAVLVLAKELNLIPACGPLLLAMRVEGCRAFGRCDYLRRGVTVLLRRKTDPYQANGVRLGWLLLPHERGVEIWRGGQQGMG